MGQSYTAPNSAIYVNINDCRSFNQNLSTTLVALSAYICSEVIVINKTGQDIRVYDSGYSNISNHILLSNNESMVFRGITNSQQVSCQTLSGGGTVYYRTAYYSNLPQR